MNAHLETFQKVAYFCGALAHGAESNIGQGTHSICFLAGKRLAQEALGDSETTSDPVQALKIVAKALASRGIIWEGEEFLGERAALIEQDGAAKKMRIIFRTCMVRSTLFIYAREQRQSLCHMAHGIFAGAMEKVMPGSSVKLEVIQAGPEACIKEMIWEEKQ
jgi:hypothetical protein